MLAVGVSLQNPQRARPPGDADAGPLGLERRRRIGDDQLPFRIEQVPDTVIRARETARRRDVEVLAVRVSGQLLEKRLRSRGVDRRKRETDREHRQVRALGRTGQDIALGRQAHRVHAVREQEDDRSLQVDRQFADHGVDRVPQRCAPADHDAVDDPLERLGIGRGREHDVLVEGDDEATVEARPQPLDVPSRCLSHGVELVFHASAAVDHERVEHRPHITRQRHDVCSLDRSTAKPNREIGRPETDTGVARRSGVRLDAEPHGQEARARDLGDTRLCGIGPRGSGRDEHRCDQDRPPTSATRDGRAGTRYLETGGARYSVEHEIDAETQRELASELDNFEEIARCLKPSAGQIPRLDGLDIAGVSIPLRGKIGGDHILYIDFRRRFDLEARITRAEADGRTELAEQLRRTQERAGILVADVAGHRMTDAMIGAMLHQAFLLGSNYEMDEHGEITTRLFEHINTRFYQSSAIHKYLTMIYGEISTSGVFRFISAGHPPPIVFSRRFARIADIAADRLKRYPPIGIVPSGDDVDRALLEGAPRFKDRYSVNEISLLGAGDVLLLATDGVFEHGEGSYFPDVLEKDLARTRDLSAREISNALKRSILDFAAPADDISFVVIKRG